MDMSQIGINPTEEQAHRVHLLRLVLSRDTIPNDEYLELLKDRPEGCWCLGLGYSKDIQVDFGRDIVDLAERWKYVAADPCDHCEEGKDANAFAIKTIRDADARCEDLRRSQLWKSLDIPKRFHDVKLSTLPKDVTYSSSDGTPVNVDTFLDVGGSYLVHGDNGVGKTCLGITYIKAAINSGKYKSVCWITAPQLLGYLRATYNQPQTEGKPTEEQLLDWYIKVGLLVIDDLGAEQLKAGYNGEISWGQDRLFRIIGERHDEMRDTFITSNKSMIELGERLGERTTWRIVESCGPSHIIKMAGANQRAFDLS